MQTPVRKAELGLHEDGEFPALQGIDHTVLDVVGLELPGPDELVIDQELRPVATGSDAGFRRFGIEQIAGDESLGFVDVFPCPRRGLRFAFFHVGAVADDVDAAGEAHRALVQLAGHVRDAEQFFHALGEARLVRAFPQQEILSRAAVGGQFPLTAAQGELAVAEADQAVPGAQAADPVDELELADVDRAQVMAAWVLLQDLGRIHKEPCPVGALRHGVGERRRAERGQAPPVVAQDEEHDQDQQQAEAAERLHEVPAQETVDDVHQGVRRGGEEQGIDGGRGGGGDDLVQHGGHEGRGMGRDAQCHGIHGPGGEQQTVLGRVVLEGGGGIGPNLEVHFTSLESFSASRKRGIELGDIVWIGAFVGQHHAVHLVGEAYRTSLAGEFVTLDPSYHSDRGIVIDLA